MITVYSKDNCVYCARARNLLNSRNVKFIEQKLGVDFDVDFITKAFPTMKTFPIIVNNNDLVGGYMQLLEEVADNEFFGKDIIKG